MFRPILTASAAALAICAALTAPAQALTMKECSAKYQAAREAGTLKDQKWNAFRKAECGGDEDAPEAEAAAAVANDPNEAAAPAGTVAPKPAAAGKAVFPSAISTQYANETPGKARMRTCVDQYKANKANGGNADLKWIQKGGGYYSLCNAKLKS